MYIQPVYSVQCSKYRLIGDKYEIFPFQIQDICTRTISMAIPWCIQRYPLFYIYNLLFARKWPQETSNLHTLKT